jgi:hypothetical protein
MNMNSNDQGAAQAKAWMNHIEMERQSQSTTRIVGAKREMQSAMKTSGNQERTPVHASLARLTELINVLECRSAVLTDRLAAILRPVMAGDGGSGSEEAQGPSCALDDELYALATRIESVIERIDSTRNRLCI